MLLSHLHLHVLLAVKLRVNQHPTHVNAQAATHSPKWRWTASTSHLLHLLLHVRGHLSRLRSSLHLETLHLDQVVHVAAWGSLLESTLHGGQLRRLALGGLLLHLELDVVENTVEVHRIQFDRHLDSWILLEVNQWRLTLRIYHATCLPFYPLPFVHCDLFAVEHQQLDQSFDHNHPVVGLPCYRILQHRQLEQMGQLRQLFNLEQLLDPVARDEERLELFKLLDVGE